MSRGARWSLLGLCLLLLVAGMLQPDPQRTISRTTFGVAPEGYQAVFDLFTTLGLAVQRSYDPPAGLPPDATVWWIEPDGVCRERRESSEEDAGSEDWRGEEWIADGGTAVVFLPSERHAADDCRSVAGVDVPKRRVESGSPRESVNQEIAGPLTSATRSIVANEMSTFEESGAAQVIAWDGDRPFALLYWIGQGRLVLVADSAFLRNRWLDRADAAPLAMDFARSYGVPRFDERSHGMHRERAPLRFLVRSAAWPVLLGGLALGLLFLWSGQALPPRRAPAGAVGAPTLAVFVDSLARLYAGTGDFARVFERYRLLAGARLRRHFALPAETPMPALLDRLVRSRRVSRERLAPLAGGVRVTSAAELRAAARALDAVVDEVMR